MVGKSEWEMPIKEGAARRQLHHSAYLSRKALWPHFPPLPPPHSLRWSWAACMASPSSGPLAWSLC